MQPKFSFYRFARLTSKIVGHPMAFCVAILVIVIWAIIGPIFHFSDTWQLVINTGTTIVTFLIVFLIQNTQNRDGEALQLKLDELIRALRTADNKILDIEDLGEQDLERLQAHYAHLAQLAQSRLPRKEEEA
jgi:low affinity Fe/Cu permease